MLTAETGEKNQMTTTKKYNKCFCLTKDSNTFTKSDHGAYDFYCGKKKKVHSNWRVRSFIHSLKPSLSAGPYNLCDDILGMDPEVVRSCMYMLEDILTYDLSDEGDFTWVVGDPTKIVPYEDWKYDYVSGSTFEEILLNYYEFDFIINNGSEHGFKMRIYTEDEEDIQYGTANTDNTYNAMGTWQEAVDLGESRPNPYFILDNTVTDGFIIWDELIAVNKEIKYMCKEAFFVETGYGKVCNSGSTIWESNQEAYEHRFEKVSNFTTTSDYKSVSYDGHYYWEMTLLEYFQLVPNDNYLGDKAYPTYSNYGIYYYKDNWRLSLTAPCQIRREGDMDKLVTSTPNSITKVVSMTDGKLDVGDSDFNTVDPGTCPMYLDDFIYNIENHPSRDHTHDDAPTVVKGCWMCDTNVLDVEDMASNCGYPYLENRIAYGMPGGKQYYVDNEMMDDDWHRLLKINLTRFNPDGLEDLPPMSECKIDVTDGSSTAEYMTFLDGSTEMTVSNIDTPIYLKDTRIYEEESLYLLREYEVRHVVEYDQQYEGYYGPERYGTFLKCGFVTERTQLTHEGSEQYQISKLFKNIFEYDFVIDSNINFGAIRISNVWHKGGPTLDITYTEFTPANQEEYAPVSTVVNFRLPTTAPGKYKCKYNINFINCLVGSYGRFELILTFKIS